MSDPRSAESFLVIRASSVGDIVLTEPVVTALKAARPSAEIGFVVKERFRDLVAGNQDITRLHLLRNGSVRDLLRLSAEIRRARYVFVVDLHRNSRSLLLRRRSGARAVTVYRKRDPGDALRVRLGRARYRARLRIVERYLESLAPLGIERGYRRPRFHLAQANVEWAGSFLEERGLPAEGFVAMVPGSVWPTKRWPAEGYGAVARAVSGETGLPVLLLGSRGERALCALVAEASGATNAAGETTLGRMAALIARAGLYVGNDSGPTHIATALDVPTVAIFGPTDPGQFDFDGHALVYADLECSACSFFGTERCRLGHWSCMRSISPGDVIGAALELLDRTGDRS